MPVTFDTHQLITRLIQGHMSVEQAEAVSVWNEAAILRDQNLQLDRRLAGEVQLAAHEGSRSLARVLMLPLIWLQRYTSLPVAP